MAARKKASRNDPSQTDGIDAIANWLMTNDFLVKKMTKERVYTFTSDTVIESQKTISSLLAYGSSEVAEYVTRFFEIDGYTVIHIC